MSTSPSHSSPNGGSQPARRDPAGVSGKARVIPKIDATRCEAKGPCVQVCPENVFEIRRLTEDERSSLPWMSRLKAWVHGGKQGFVARPEACAGCGRCVPACPENAVSLHPVRADFA